MTIPEVEAIAFVPILPKRKGRGLFQFIKFAVIAFAIAIPVRWFVVQPFIVSGLSMAPTFEADEYLVVDKLVYRFGKPQRGDVVIFRYPLDPSIYFIKRVVGMPGETVDIDNGVLSVIEKDSTRVVLSEPYVPLDTPKKESVTTTLASDEYFVLGDNRDESSDSREWGPLQEKFIVGRALMRVWPLQKAALFPGSDPSQTP